MSMSANGRHVTCDGEGCQAQADIPVALRPMLGQDKVTERVDGWLFVWRRGEWCHYCPSCLPFYLESLSESFKAELK